MKKKTSGSLDADRMSRLVDELPLTMALKTTPVPLPEVQAPSLEGLEVTVPRPEDLREDEVGERLHELLRANSQKRDRSQTEAIQTGDEVLVDIIGYADGKLIPFSIRSSQWLEVWPLPMLPGLTESLVGAKVGDSVEAKVTLPNEYPAAALRGKEARFLVDIKAAREVSVPSAEDPAFLKKLGRGETVEQLLQSIIEELEAELTDGLWVEAQNLVLDEVAARAKVSVPNELVDEELRRRWGQSEGKLLAEKKFSNEEQREAMALWLQDPLMRADAERRIKISLTLKAIAERDELELTSEWLKEFLESAANAYGLDPEAMRKALLDDKSPTSPVKNVAWHLMAVGHVMNHAKVHFE